jgi:hypothetical protein
VALVKEKAKEPGSVELAAMAFRFVSGRSAESREPTPTREE